MSANINRDLYNYCVQSFVRHDYETALFTANQLVKQGSLFPIYMILLLSAQHVKRSDAEINTVGDQMLEAIFGHRWEYILVQFILGRVKPGELLMQAVGDEHQCQANYYIGAQNLVKNDLHVAHQYFQASLSHKSECLEQTLAKLELEHFPRYVKDNSGLSEKLQNSDGEKLWEFDVLLEKLASEHKPGFVYRGQVRDYGSMFPSGYRKIVDMQHPAFYRQADVSMYDRGNVFRPLLSTSQRSEPVRKLIDFVSVCRGQLGYLLSQLFCQHCCLPTEGLDVTEDIDIASLFAIYDYPSGSFVSETDHPGMIIRINVGNPQPLSMRRLKEIDFYSCPFYVSGTEILNLFDRCKTSSQAEQCFREYFEEKLDLEMRLESWDEFRKSRPLELIMLPAGDLPKSRVMMQRAGLVFPDVLLPRAFDDSPVPPPPGKTWDGPQCVEDLAKNNAVETFFFRHHPNNKTKINRVPTAVFPDIDPIKSLLSGIFTAMAPFSIAIVNQDTTTFTTGDEQGLIR